MSKSPITCHVLDSTLGKPAANVRVQLEALSPQNSQFRVLATGATNSDGRCADLIAGQDTKKVLVAKGVYRMTFFTGEYFDKAGRATFYPQVEILFQLSESPDPHYHIPLLLSPFSYTTYRGS
ncbi:related to 5-hydroxyisourate hydrolase [Ustilago sp. UG-2017b]|nr:related to 5-hydroxyisourate hydrolase [Ustilago sp. UG-2017b]